MATKIYDINGKPYSKELVELLKDKDPHFCRKVQYASLNPYEYTSTGDRITLLFDQDEGKGVSLPLQTNATWVSNLTDYTSEPKWKFLKDLFRGKLVDISQEKLTDFLKRVVGVESHVEYRFRGTKEQGPDGRGSHGYLVRLPSKDIVIDSDLPVMDKRQQAAEYFSSVHSRFLVSPDSIVRIETRDTRKGDRIYNASLDFYVGTGLSGVPGIDETLTPSITVTS